MTGPEPPGQADAVHDLDGPGLRRACPNPPPKPLRNGKVALVAEPGPDGAVVYRFDDTNPEGRTARMLADRALQRAAGRRDPVASTDRLMREPGSRYIDFLIPGLLGMNLMGSAIWGMGFAIVDARRKKLIKRLVATPMPRHYYLLSFVLSRLLLLVVEVGVVLGFGVLVFQVPVRGSLVGLAAVLRSQLHRLLRAGAADRLARADHRSRFRPDERGDDAHVDLLRRLLFGAAIPRRHAAGNQGAASDGGDRRATR